MSKVWTTDDIPDQSGKVVVVTGGNSGIGFEAALALAKKKATVILAVRNMEKGNAALKRLKSAYHRADVKTMKLDLNHLSIVREFAADFLDKHESLSVLINNAGIMNPPLRLTKDGFESQFGGNHLGHFALTGLLLPRLISTPNSRVVTQSSLLAHNAAIDFDNLDGSKGYSRKFYGQSKLANLLFAKELQQKFAAHHIDSVSIACHPGISHTNLGSFGSGKQANLIFRILSSLISQPADMGALPALYSATSPAAKGGNISVPTENPEKKAIRKATRLLKPCMTPIPQVGCGRSRNL